MKRKLSARIVAILMLAAAMVSFFSMSAQAEKDEVATFVPDVDLPDNDELFSMYVESLFYGDLYSDIMPFSMGTHMAGARLTGDGKAIYDALVPYMKNIASGQRSSTEIDFGTVSFSADTLKKQFSSAISALLLDYPYEMYWFDKAREGANTYRYRMDGSGMVCGLIVSFKVASDFAIGGIPDTYKVDTNVTKSVPKAVANAQAVVKANAGKSDYAKLCAYKEYICDAVSYNDDAIKADYSGGMNPWQMIYVFDGDSNTNVVCEGYSKAFQYLCDMTTWSSSEAQCYSVSGTMIGGTGAGAHMWNIVTLDGENYYLADVTNSDKGSAGQNGELFMAGAPGSVANGYVFTAGGQRIGFAYDDRTVSMWGTEVLTLASSNYDNSKKALESLEITRAPSKTEYVEGETFNADGMVVTAIYSTGGEPITTYTVSPNRALTTSDKAVTVSYTEGNKTVTATQAITVKAKAEPVVLTGIKITTNPSKMTYTEGETFDATGMEVTAVYSNGNEMPVSTGYEVSPSGALEAGATTVTVSYTVDGKTVSVELTGITVTAKTEKPAKTYTVTVENGAGSGSYAEGASVSIAANAPEAGMRFAGWTGLEGLTITIGAAANTRLTFTMPARDVTVSAVYDDAAVPVSGITLNESQIDLTVGGAFNLIATVLPDDAANKNVIWSNSNPAVATFTEGSAARAATSAREGVVTALAAGSTVITVRTEDGGFAAACKVTVSAREKPLSVDASGSQRVSVRKGDTVEMSVVVSGGVAPYKYQWYISRNNEPFVAYEGSTSATHATTSVDESNSGYRYFCRVTDSKGQTFDSPIFTLDVIEKTDLPDTGDHRQLGLWLMLCVMGLAGVSILLWRTRKAQN